MDATVLERLKQLAESGHDVYFSPPPTERELARVCKRSEDELGIALPDAYVQLLRMTDGVQINNAVFESSGTLISCNLDLRKTNPMFSTHIALGHQGNMERYVFSSRNNEYQTVSFFSPEDVFEFHHSFDALVMAIIGDLIL